MKTSIAKVNEELFDVVDDINNRMRWNNLIVKGIAETEKEGYEESETIAKEFFATHLGVQAGDIERAHRLGQRRANVDWPIIVKFLNFKSKMGVLRNGPKLKKLENLKVWLDKDFSPKVQLARKKLRDFVKATRTDNESYSLRFNLLYMCKCIYRYDSSTGIIVEVPARYEHFANNTTRKQNTAGVATNHEPATAWHNVSARPSAAQKTTANRKLSIILANFRSIYGKLDELKALIYTCNADIIFGTETWLKADTENSELSFPAQFAIFRQDRHLSWWMGAYCY